jgi:ABC-2 type transport system ATP-binding protein
MIKIRSFTKRYDRFTAVKDLTLEIPKGEIFGLIGPNGAGKTTTIRFLATLLRPSQGEAWIAGRSVTRDVQAVRQAMGYMPDAFGVYDGMRVWEFLDFFAAAYRIPRDRRRTILDDVLQIVDLTAKRDALVNALSRGMKQRLCLAKTLVHDPPVLILDEPASGLDPRARLEIQELLKELRAMGKTILVSSHILTELAGYCTQIGIMERGTLRVSGPIDAIAREVRQTRVVEIETLGREADLLAALQRHPRISALEPAGRTVRFAFGGTDEELVALHERLVADRLPLLWFREVETNLEEVFLKVTRGEVG